MNEQALSNSDELISIATFPDPASGNVARSALEASGIPVFMQGENANSLLPVAFETHLFVRSADVDAARELLDEHISSLELPADEPVGVDPTE